MSCDLKLALLGGLLCTLCDGFHVHTGTLRYPFPLAGLPVPQAWFVLPLFCVVFYVLSVVFRVAAASALPRGSFTTSTCDAGTACSTLTGFAFTYILTGYANREPRLLAMLLFSSAALRLWTTRDRPFMLCAAIALAVGGVLTESGISALGHMFYREPEVFGTPVWLAALYMHGAFALRDGTRWLA